MKCLRIATSFFLFISSLAVGSARDVEMRFDGDERHAPEAALIYKDGDSIVYATCGAAAACDRATGEPRRRGSFAAYWSEILPIFEVDAGILANPKGWEVLERNMGEAKKRMELASPTGALPNRILYEKAEDAYNRFAQMKTRITRMNTFLKRFEQGTPVTVESYEALWPTLLRPLNRLPDLVKTDYTTDLVTRRQWFYGGQDLNFTGAREACRTLGARLPTGDELRAVQYWLPESPLAARVKYRKASNGETGRYLWTHHVHVSSNAVSQLNTVVPYYGVEFVYVAIERPAAELRQFIVSYFDVPVSASYEFVTRAVQAKAIELAPRTASLEALCISEK